SGAAVHQTSSERGQELLALGCIQARRWPALRAGFGELPAIQHPPGFRCHATQVVYCGRRMRSQGKEKPMANEPKISTLDKVTFKDGLFALFGLLLTLAGLVILPKDFKTGVTTLTFFGACFATAVYIILRKLRLQRQ